MAQCETGYVKAALTANGREPSVEGTLDASPAAEHDLLVNLRALGDPPQLRKIVESALHRLRVAQPVVQAFRPIVGQPFWAASRSELDPL
jgi:hypothetical protein